MKRQNNFLILALLAAVVIVLSGWMAESLADEGVEGLSSPVAETTKEPASRPPAAAPSPEPDAAPALILQDQVPPIPGPKRTVAVGKFDAIGAFTSKYGNWDIGGGLAAMLTSALVESGRFIVLERANIKQVLSEQEMRAAGVSQTGPEVRKLSGVQLLIYGAVTEFGAQDRGGGVSVGFSGGGVGNLFSGGLSGQSASGSVAMDLRLVDTTSGRVVETIRVKEPISSTGFDVSGGYQGISLGSNQFNKTPLGEASRRAITKAVQAIAIQAAKAPWIGRVVEFNGSDMYINAGTHSGLQVDDQFVVERVVKKFTDPETGELLSVRKKKLGVLKLTGVEKKIAFGTFQPLEMDVPKRGDLVTFFR